MPDAHRMPPGLCTEVAKETKAWQKQATPIPMFSVSRLRFPGLLLALVGVVSCAAAPTQVSPLRGDWPEGCEPSVVGSRVAARFLEMPHRVLKASGTIHYAEVCTWYGALVFARESADQVLLGRLAERCRPLFGGAEERLLPPADHVDHSIFGVVPLELYLQSSLTRWRALGLEYADAQWDKPRADGLSNQSRFWIDDMYMLLMLQVQAYRATGASVYLERAADSMAAYLDKLQQPDGLFYHRSDVPFNWGRGNGWMAAGMTELLLSMPETHRLRPRIMEAYRRMMQTLLRHQRADGLWCQLVDKPDSWPESSCTGMFAFAFITGVREGWLEASSYGPAARKAWISLVGLLTPDHLIREVCEGTGARNDYQYYLDRARITGDYHGQAPVLWCAAALLKASAKQP